MRFHYLNRYEFGDIAGYPPEKIDELEKRMNEELHIRTEAGNVTGTHSQPDIEMLSQWEARMQSITDAIRSEEAYQKLLEAYRTDDQSGIKKLINSVWSSPSPLAKYERQKAAGRFFHGVTPRKVTLGVAGTDFDEEKPPVDSWVSPAEYISLCRKIRKEGLRPSEGLHPCDMDENIRPVFVVDDYEDTYGLLFFGFRPEKKGYFVWEDEARDIGEYVIYTPVLKLPMSLYLKSAELVSHAPERVIGDCSEPELERMLVYRDQLEKKLTESGVRFRVAEPRYMNED